MRPANSPGIPVIGVSEHFEALVDEYIVHKKIGQTVCKNPQTNGKSRPKAKIAPTNKTPNANQSIKKKKIIVTFPPASVVFVVMVLVQIPQKTVHDVFMGKPGHEFHNAESYYENEYPKEGGHRCLLIR